MLRRVGEAAISHSKEKTGFLVVQPGRIPTTPCSWQKEIPEYLRYYDEERPHMALGMKTPSKKIAEWLQAIDR